MAILTPQARELLESDALVQEGGAAALLQELGPRLHGPGRRAVATWFDAAGYVLRIPRAPGGASDPGPERGLTHRL